MRSVKALCWPWSHIFLTETRRGDSPRALPKYIRSQIASTESRECMRTRLDNKDFYALGGELCAGSSTPEKGDHLYRAVQALFRCGERCAARTCTVMLVAKGTSPVQSTRWNVLNPRREHRSDVHKKAIVVSSW